MATNINKVFSGYQLCDFSTNHQHFRDHLYPHHQGSDSPDDGSRDVSETLVVALMVGTDMVPEMLVVLTN
jgi:hypothetical protein